ncbi:MAG: PKD domain-containing protein [Bacteroidota bacterium]|nr:PKD domain-containing protein [Bacteroidota bacterium]
MKKIIFLTTIIPFFIYSCEISPRAYFSASPGDPVVGEEVWFTNESDNAESFEWDFGDGYISNEINPGHTYTASGSFTVTLKAWSHNGLSDEASLTLSVMIPTLLEIEVLEYYDEYPVEGASVILYPTLTDWDKETNSINEGFTDADGKVVFAGLDKIVYYVDVWEKTHDNYALRDEDVGFIRTPEVLPHKINRFIAYVDYVDHGKGEARRDKTMVIRKLERKADDKKQPGVASDSSDWQILYNKAIRKK